MSKKQTIRTLGSIERTQPTQPTLKKVGKVKNKKLDLDYELESDDNIENFSDVTRKANANAYASRTASFDVNDDVILE